MSCSTTSPHRKTIKKSCASRDSNAVLLLGRQPYYPCTTSASNYNIALRNVIQTFARLPPRRAADGVIPTPIRTWYARDVVTGCLVSATYRCAWPRHESTQTVKLRRSINIILPAWFNTTMGIDVASIVLRTISYRVRSQAWEQNAEP